MSTDLEIFLHYQFFLTICRVLWFNLGMHHIPHTGDLPNTMFTAAHSAIRFEPFNYLSNDPSIASYQQVRINYNEDLSVASVDNFQEVFANATRG